MNSTPKIFKDELANTYLSKFDKSSVPDFEKKYNIISRWRKACIERDLLRTKETSIQGDFLGQVFDEILGYRSIINKDGAVFYQYKEAKNAMDSTRPDSALGFFSSQNNLHDVRVIVELKDAITDLDKKQSRINYTTPVEQAFSYVPKNGGTCGWVVVSNFIETRLYKGDNALEYEIFDIRKMDDTKEFLRFYFFLCKEHLINEKDRSLIDCLYAKNEEIGVSISNEFYQTYTCIRSELYHNLKELNTSYEDVELLQKLKK